MALIDTINTIVSRSKRLEICDTLHDVQNATTEDELIKFGLPLWVWGYQSGVLDDALLASDFTEATLNDNRVYTTGSFTIDNPFDEIFIMRDAIVTVNLQDSLVDDARCKISVMGGGSLILVANDKSYATVKAYDDATSEITINDDAMVNYESRDNASAEVTNNNNGVFHLTTHGKSTVVYNGNDNSYALAKLFQNSDLTSVANVPAIMDAISYNAATLTLT